MFCSYLNVSSQRVKRSLLWTARTASIYIELVPPLLPPRTSHLVSTLISLQKKKKEKSKTSLTIRQIFYRIFTLTSNSILDFSFTMNITKQRYKLINISIHRSRVANFNLQFEVVLCDNFPVKIQYLFS